jgi:hypothetical protein
MSTHLAHRHRQFISASGHLTSSRFISKDYGCLVTLWTRDIPGSQSGLCIFDLFSTINYNWDGEEVKLVKRV